MASFGTIVNLEPNQENRVSFPLKSQKLIFHPNSTEVAFLKILP